MPQLPPDVAALLTEFEIASARGRGYLLRFEPRHLEHTSAPDVWTIAQCLEHLARTNLAYAGAIRQATAAALHLHSHPRRRPIEASWLTRIFLAELEPPVRRRLPAPASVRPMPVVAADAALRHFLLAQSALLDLLHESAQLDLNQVHFRSPLARWLRLSAAAGFLIVAAHNRRHLWQADQMASHLPAHRTASA